MNNTSKKVETREDFIIKYKAAIKCGLSREEFSALLNIKPKSLIRRRLAIYDSTGLNLPFLPQDSKFTNVSTARSELFFQTVKELLGNTKRNQTHNKKRYVITSAQNATPVHENFLSCILTYCEHNDAELLVIPYRYKNPTSVWAATPNDEWWSNQISEYLMDHELKLCDGLKVLGNIKIQPTATEPVTGFESFTGEDSTIIGHPKIQLKSIPTITESLHKLITSTGAITVPNYTDSKAGWSGAFHHSMGAVIVEIDNDDNIFHLRHIHANLRDGSFYDLDKKYNVNSVQANQRALALITGDTHAEFVDKSVEDATYHDSDSIANVLNPEYMVFHDLIDFYARNHHSRTNDISNVGKHRFGRNNVEEGLQQAADFIDRVSRKGTENIIVKSNHDEAFDRWLREADARGDYENAQFYYYMKYHQMRNICKTSTGFTSIDPFEFWCNNPDNETGLKNKKCTTFLHRSDSIKLGNIEIAFHGDVGPNGSRGDIKSLAKMSTKLVVGHSHSPAIYEGAYMVGTSSRLDLEYKRGPSSWMHTHCVIYPDGKRSLIHIIKGKWKL